MNGEHPTTWLSTSPSQYTLGQFGYYPPERENAPKRYIARDETNNDGAEGDVVIGNDVWIGAGATIRRGVNIGDGAIVAGDAYVTKDVEPYSIVVGIPAKHMRFRFSHATIVRLMALKWWRFDINHLAGVAFDNIERAMDEIEQREASGQILPTPVAYNQVRIYTKGYHSLVMADEEPKPKPAVSSSQPTAAKPDLAPAKVEKATDDRDRQEISALDIKPESVVAKPTIEKTEPSKKQAQRPKHNNDVPPTVLDAVPTLAQPNIVKTDKVAANSNQSDNSAVDAGHGTEQPHLSGPI